MNCETLIDYLSDYIDQELDEEISTEAREHLATCQNCSVVLDSTQKMILLYRDQDKKVIPAARRENLFNQIQEAFSKKSDE